ncbi:MAG TPA: hypothetical protein PK198_24430, partial [Saprospiraceae bacterium]|nr:hypothetical protein [Saprospiraceae bacterium]
MNILLIGSGGREHALAWKMKQSQLCSRLLIAPGNSGTAACGENVAIRPDDFQGLKALALREQIDMLVVGPEDPLVLGIWDFFKNDPDLQHIIVVGPSQEGARLEGSKAFAKAFMQEFGIPTAAYREFDAAQMEEGLAYIAAHSLPVVLKADGLAAGKGVLICTDTDEAQREFERIVARYVDLADVGERLYAVESRNIGFFGYGVKGMTLSMIEAAVEITDARISGADVHRIVALAKDLLRHPVEVLDGDMRQRRHRDRV